ncbi:hypothetical protein [Phenylobacterium sp.]|jgi:hypothetical protein|uniref:hypothetical protein n=1 Tax=Phenylobacterium sp. TaxID=1871053 RepID=UPI002F9486C8
MSPSEQLKQLPGYLAFNAGVIFLIGLASSLMSAEAGIDAAQLKTVGFAVLLAVLAVAAGFASVARVEFARREGRRFSAIWIGPAALVGLPLARAVVAGAFRTPDYVIAAAGLAAGLAGMAWLALKARSEARA